MANSTVHLTLLPQPRTLHPLAGEFPLPRAALIQIIARQPQALLFSATQFQQYLKKEHGLHWEIAASGFEPGAALRLVLDPGATGGPQGYRLAILPEGITITASDAAGIFYGLATLRQIASQARRANLPCLEIVDAPDFPARGVMLDISRDKVYTMETLYALVDRLAGWKINQLQLYTEHTFAYRNHPLPWQNASPMTGEEILLLDAYCRQRFVELVPNQNSFGHLEHWLSLEPYQHLAEIHGEFDVPWGKAHGPFSLSPAEPGSLELIRSLYDELLPHFTSRILNIGADETFDIGMGKSKALCDEKSIPQVYLDFLLELYREVKRRGFTMMYWGDIICRHPELIPQLPQDAIGLLWGYEASHPFDAEGAAFAAARVPFYMCPGTSSWNTIAGRLENALGNLRSAAENGIQYGAAGYLNTDWGDSGHWQVPPISYPGFAAGAAYAWCLKSNRNLNLAEALNRHAFADLAHEMGGILVGLGNLYQKAGVDYPNSTVFHHLLARPLAEIAAAEGLQADSFDEVLITLDALEQHLAQARMACPDAELIEREVKNTIRLVRHACKRALLALMVKENAPESEQARAKSVLGTEWKQISREYRDLWLARAREGGLADSMGKFKALEQDYDL
ncbi:MAG: family 20 glycosylhydrolase [Anaerolineae bacterium]|nr:family 20 glycosylhydrolase [Anaerolineae bacterium]